MSSPLTKSVVISIFGSKTAMAKAIGIKTQSIAGWDEKLTSRTRDRVEAAMWREGLLRKVDGDWFIIPAPRPLPRPKKPPRPKPSRRLSPEERFWAKVEKTDGCWIWSGATNKSGPFGYGQFRIPGNRVPAHRVAWEMIHGPVPEGLWVLHDCDMPKCVNPSHLFLGTAKDNAADMIAKGRNRRHIDP